MPRLRLPDCSMHNPPPAQVGNALAEVETPALLVDLDAFEHNLDLMARTVAASGLRLRPHAKTHKCAPIALQQMARGAVGVCCQKLSEAEALVAGGVPDVLITNQIVDAPKLARLAQLAQQARIGICVDHPDNVAALAQAANAENATLDVLIEVDVGGGRCGVSPGGDVAGLAASIAEHKSLRFRGIHAYQGRAQHVRGWDDRRRAIEESSAKTRAALAALDRHGIPCEIVTGGGTGTYLFETASRVYNELQPGSYIFMDADYRRNETASSAPRFEQSLFVLAQVMSVPRPGMAVVDAGLKALAFDSGVPLIAGAGDSEYQTPSDDHGIIACKSPRYRLGEKLRLVPGHCDPTVNLYDWFVGIRDERVEVVWPIARGTVR